MSDNAIKTKEGNLILDSHKLSYHFERVKAWENGEKIAPVCVEQCVHFVMQWFRNPKKEPV